MASLQGLLQKKALAVRPAALVLALLLLFVSCAVVASWRRPLATASGGTFADVSIASTFFQRLSDAVVSGRDEARFELVRSEISDVRGELERLNADQVATQAAIKSLSQSWSAFFDDLRRQGRAKLTGAEGESPADRTLNKANEPAGRENELLSAQSNVASQTSNAQEGELRQCTSESLLGSWQNSTFVPLPYDAMQVFRDEAEGPLSPERKAGLKYVGNDFGSILDAFPDLVDNLTERTDGQLGFEPPCFYRFYLKEDILRLFAGKWVFLTGDSNTRALALGLLTILDPTHNQPYSDVLWFNGTGEWDEFPHIAIVDYFFREDGSIVYKTARQILTQDNLPAEPYSVRISFRMREDVANMIKYIPEMLGDKDWQPDLLYFNTGSWDAFLQQRGDRNWTEPDRLYGVLMDYIVSTCDPARQVCVWGSLTSNVGFSNVLYHSKLALMQWRQMARIMRARVAGTPTRLHLLDRFWSSHVSNQRMGGHYGHMVNIWDIQRLFNVYEGTMNEKLRLEGVKRVEFTEGERSGERSVEKGTRHGRKAPQCKMRVEEGHVVRAECDWFPERVTFAEGCVLVPDEEAESTSFYNYTMWETNCEAEVDFGR